MTFFIVKVKHNPQQSGSHDGEANVNIKCILGEKNFNYVYLDNSTEKGITKLMDLFRVILLIAEYRNFTVQSYLFKLLCKQALITIIYNL